MDLWSFTAIVAVAGASGLIAAVVFALVGGLGGIRSVQRAVDLQEHRISDVDERLTRDQKRRAGQARQDTPSEADLRVQAAEVLARAGPTGAVPGERPSVVSIRR